MAFLQLRMEAPVLESFITPNAARAYKWCETRWSNTQPPQSENIKNITDSDKLPFDIHTSLSKESFLKEPHAWSVPFDDFSLSDVAAMDLSDWWALKASKGNGGRDVWVVNRFNYTEVFNTVPTNDEYILQRYRYIVVCVQCR